MKFDTLGGLHVVSGEWLESTKLICSWWPQDPQIDLLSLDHIPIKLWESSW